MPKKGYWVALADVSDPEGYKLYAAENANAFRKYHGRFLARGGQSETPEGTTRSRVVIIEFPDYKAAQDCYRSPEYAKAMALRDGKSVMDLAIVEGYDGLQPTTLFDHQAVFREDRWSPNSIQLVIGIVCLAIGAAWLGGFPGFLIAIGFILIAGIALKH
jgi:uncharacterized protein (DUF1330 family)